MRTIEIKIKLQYDDSQSTDQSIVECVQNILEAHEHMITQCELVDLCPKCESDNIEIVESPVQRFFRCYVCNHEWTGRL
jgi:hypothetical protein